MMPRNAVRCVAGSVNDTAALSGTGHCAAHEGIAP